MPGLSPLSTAYLNPANLICLRIVDWLNMFIHPSLAIRQPLLREAVRRTTPEGATVHSLPPGPTPVARYGNGVQPDPVSGVLGCFVRGSCTCSTGGISGLLRLVRSWAY